MYVGMPAALLLDEFGSQVWAAFGEPPYLVGSALENKQWRDVDVRLILADETYKEMGFGDPLHTHHNAKWVALCLAFSALGKQITGLPIDFQIQQRTRANAEYNGRRSALGVTPLRIARMDNPCSGGENTETDATPITQLGSDNGNAKKGCGS